MTLLALFVSFSAFAADPIPAPAAATKSAEKPAKAESTKAKSTKEKAAKAKTEKSKSAKAKTAAPEPPSLTEEQALASFETFTVEWMNKLIQTADFQRTEHIKITESPEGITAEYVGYRPERSIWVKKTKYPHTPFTGILSYYETTMRCVGKTKEEAIKGPFEQGELKPVSEIFRFSQEGKWVY
ncbi:MAG: hypothetical protein ACREQ3_20005 [Candidatus Binatia bacterium]